MPLRKIRKPLVVVIALVALAVASASLLSPRLQHWTQRLVVKTEMGLSRLCGNKPMFASITGQSGIPGARVVALDSRSGWATLCDREGRFVLPGVVWYPGASYDLVVSTDERRGRKIRITAPSAAPDAGVVNAGMIDLTHGGEVDLARTSGVTFISNEDYDFQNRDYYRELYDRLTAGKLRDEERIDAVNNYVAERLNYNETQKELGSPRRVVEGGSQFCGHLATTMATILAVAYTVRVVDLSDGAARPNTHVVVEVLYRGAWHLYDPTFGVKFETSDGRVASYRDLRLDPSLISDDRFEKFRQKHPKIPLSWMPGVYRSGYHHLYYPAFKCSQYSHGWWDYQNGLDYVPSGGRVWLSAAGVRPGTTVTFHIRRAGSDVDELTLTTRGKANSCCVLNQEESPPIRLAPGSYAVYVDLQDGNVGKSEGMASAAISDWHLSKKLEVK